MCLLIVFCCLLRNFPKILLQSFTKLPGKGPTLPDDENGDVVVEDEFVGLYRRVCLHFHNLNEIRLCLFLLHRYVGFMSYDIDMTWQDGLAEYFLPLVSFLFRRPAQTSISPGSKVFSVLHVNFPFTKVTMFFKCYLHMTSANWKKVFTSGKLFSAKVQARGGRKHMSPAQTHVKGNMSVGKLHFGSFTCFVMMVPPQVYLFSSFCSGFIMTSTCAIQ